MSRMTHMDRLVFRCPPRDFSSWILYYAVVLLVLTGSCGGQSQVIGTSQPIVAMVGDDVTLPCHPVPGEDATDWTVEWARPDLEPRFVHLRRNGAELDSEEHPLFRGRTSLSTDNLKCGDISLKLSAVKLSDAGTYNCLVPTSGVEAAIKLSVGSVSSPEIDISKVSSGLILECKSGGWYPEPDVLWLDSEGHVLSAGPPETVRGPDGLYTVSSRVTVEKRHGNRFTCRVQQKTTNQTKETQIHVGDDVFKVQSNSVVRIVIFLAVGVLSVVAVVLIVWKLGQNKTKTPKYEEERGKMMTSVSPELQLLLEGDMDGQHIRTGSEKLKYLEETKTKLDERLKKNEEELEHVNHVISTLKTQKDKLRNQRDKLKTLQLEDVRQIEEKKGKLKEKPKLDVKKKEKKRVDAKTNIERRKKEHDELITSTDEQLKTTEDMIDGMIERKGKLERDNEQIRHYLRETERQIGDTQRTLQSEGEDNTEGQKTVTTKGHETQTDETQGDETQRNLESGTEGTETTQSHNNPL